MTRGLRPPSTCLVVGGGFIGTASALRLQRAGVDTTLIDPGDIRKGASFGNIGHIAAEQCEPLASLASLASFPGRLFAFGGPLDFRFRDADLWLPWSVRFAANARPSRFEHGVAVLTGLLGGAMASWQALLDETGCPDVLDETGHAVVWMKPGAAAKGRARWAKARSGTTASRAMTDAELSGYEAALGQRPAGGLIFTGTGQVSEPVLALQALAGAFERAGGQVVRDRVTALSVRQGTTVATLANGGEVTAGAALVSAGAWSAPLLAPFGLHVPLIAERGYSIQSPEHDWPADLPLTVFEERAMVLARFRSGLRAASFVEFGRPDAPPDPRKWAALETGLRALDVPVGPRFDRWSGSRPTLPDYLPAIGRLAETNIYYAFGHQHLGLTLATVTADMIRDALVEGSALPGALAADRFRRL